MALSPWAQIPAHPPANEDEEMNPIEDTSITTRTEGTSENQHQPEVPFPNASPCLYHAPVHVVPVAGEKSNHAHDHAHVDEVEPQRNPVHPASHTNLPENTNQKVPDPREFPRPFPIVHAPKVPRVSPQKIFAYRRKSAKPVSLQSS